MIRQITVAGEQCPADFSIMTLAEIAAKYNTDITALGERLSGDTPMCDHLEFIATVGVVALNAGAQRLSIDKRYTVYDLYDAMTVDLSLAETLITAFSETIRGVAVFPKPSKMTAKRTAKSQGDV